MNLQQAKALFFAQYLGQKAEYLLSDNDEETTAIGLFYNIDFDGNSLIQRDDKMCDESNIDDNCLLLRSVSQLTDEELQVFAKHSAYRLDEKNTFKIGKAMIDHMFELNSWSGNTILFLTDYLRSIGILLPFTYLDENNKPLTLETDGIIALGWAKIN